MQVFKKSNIFQVSNRIFCNSIEYMTKDGWVINTQNVSGCGMAMDDDDLNGCCSVGASLVSVC